MSIPTVPVTCKAANSEGQGIAGAIFRAQLDKTEKYQGYVVPDVVEAVADENGVAILNLWPNALGVSGSLYRIVGFSILSRLKFLDTTVSVPDSPCNLHEITTASPAPTLDAAQQAILAAQGYVAQASEQAGLATEQQEIASTKAGEAAESAQEVAGVADSLAQQYTDLATTVDHQFATLTLQLVAVQALALNPYAFD